MATCQDKFLRGLPVTLPAATSAFFCLTLARQDFREMSQTFAALDLGFHGRRPTIFPASTILGTKVTWTPSIFAASAVEMASEKAIGVLTAFCQRSLADYTAEAARLSNLLAAIGEPKPQDAD